MKTQLSFDHRECRKFETKKEFVPYQPFHRIWIKPFHVSFLYGLYNFNNKVTVTAKSINAIAIYGDPVL